MIAVVRLEDPQEYALFVDLAASVDDGEAVTGASALFPSCLVATDDRKVRRDPLEAARLRRDALRDSVFRELGRRAIFPSMRGIPVATHQAGA